MLYLVTVFTEGLFIALGYINNVVSLVATGIFASLLYSVTLTLVIRSAKTELHASEPLPKSTDTQEFSPEPKEDIEPSTPVKKKGLDPLYVVVIIQGVFTLIAALIAKLL